MAAPPPYELSDLKAEDSDGGSVSEGRTAHLEDIITPREMMTDNSDRQHVQDTLDVTKPSRAAYPITSQSDAAGASVWHTGQSTTVVVNQPPFPPPFRPCAVQMIKTDHATPTVCFNCGESTVTYVYYESGSCTYMGCLCLACIGCDCGCCLLPFFMDICKDVIHKCPRCHVILGKHKRM